MSGRDLLSDARALLGAASTTSDPDLRALYCGKARAMYVQLMSDAQAFGGELAAVEAELLRAAKVAKAAK